MLCSLVSVSSLCFKGVWYLSVFLFCSTGVFIRNNDDGSQNTRMRWGEKVGRELCDLLRMGLERKGINSMLLAKELGLRLGLLDSSIGRRGVGLPSVYLLLWRSSSWVSRKCLLELRSLTKKKVKWRKIRRGRSVKSAKDGSRGQERLAWVLCHRTRNKTWGLGLRKGGRGESLWEAYLLFWEVGVCPLLNFIFPQQTSSRAFIMTEQNFLCSLYNLINCVNLNHDISLSRGSNHSKLTVLKQQAKEAH